MPGSLTLQPLPNASFGALARFADAAEACAVVAAAEATGEDLPAALMQARGLLVFTGMQGISETPELLLRLSRIFGPEVENYHHTLTDKNNVHPMVPEIYVVSDIPPSTLKPPPPPDPPRTAEGGLPTRFPHRRGWHTDQSFRRPPPDISLFYADMPAPRSQGQTLYADGFAAYAALSDDLKARIQGLEGLHVIPGTGRSEYAVRAGETPQDLMAHQSAQPQPVVRRHPVSGEPALYLCEAGQMDWIEGPFVGLPLGPDGEGAALLYRLMTHFTQPAFTYVHDWNEGDLVIYDNRCLIHCATWYDAARYRRRMWRTTVWGKPGPEYAGESRSWIPAGKVEQAADFAGP